MTIVGTGGHAADIAAIARRNGIEPVHIVEHDEQRLDERLSNFHAYLLGMNDSVTRRRLDSRRHTAFSFVDPSAVISSPAYDPGSVVGAQSTIGPHVTIGRHTHVNANVFVTRAKLGDYCTVGPGAVICGDVTLGAGVMVGAGAVISNLCTVGDWAVIGAGAVVPPNTHIPSGETWIGVPAKVLG